ncbi:MAG: family 43 glycosylhydrolase [Clostridia bacterium]|nr:family 43 glycosylhydrolase [Clostridia bacterium]
MINGELWTDIDGKPIHAHGGCRLYHNGKLYWYGEDRRDNVYVSCYVSEDDGQTWAFANHVLTADSPTQKTRVEADLSLRNPSGGKVNLERPKVIYNQKTKKFVLWAHYENGENYLKAGAAVATCDTPDGDFVYHGSFRPYGEMSRDCTLFVDGDKVYFISAARDNADLHFYLLSEDCLNVSRLVNRAFSNEFREAPAIIKQDGKYLLITSECTGWKANQGGYSVADDIEGVWSDIQPFGDKTTYGSQSAFLYRNPQGDIVFFGDRWGGNGFLHGGKFIYEDSAYVGYKIEWTKQSAVLIPSNEAFI